MPTPRDPRADQAIIPHPPSSQRGPNQGEGDRVSAKRYEDHLRSFVAGGGVEPAARDAARAVDGPEAASLFAAEEAGKAPAKLSLIDRARGAWAKLVDVIRPRRDG